MARAAHGLLTQKCVESSVPCVSTCRWVPCVPSEPPRQLHMEEAEVDDAARAEVLGNHDRTLLRQSPISREHLACCCNEYRQGLSMNTVSTCFLSPARQEARSQDVGPVRSQFLGRKGKDAHTSGPRSAKQQDRKRRFESCRRADVCPAGLFAQTWLWVAGESNEHLLGANFNLRMLLDG